MIKEAILKLTRKESLKFSQAKEVFNEIFAHKVSPAQVAAFLTALKMKGENEDEIGAAATVIRKKAKKLDIHGKLVEIEDTGETILDTCGTGGSGLNKFNISTAVAFVVSAAGIRVAKHGNRAMSSSCGSADVLEELGIKIDVSPSVMKKAIQKVGIGFLYAPLYHPALKEVAKIRREMGIRTIFNVLGPLCNPAHATHQLLGVYSEELVMVLAKVLKKLGIKKAFVVWSKDLGDEVSLSDKTTVAFLDNKKISKLKLSPSDFGLKRVSLKKIEAKSVAMSAKMVNDIMNGKEGGPRDIVLANAACCLYLAGKARNLKQGVKLGAGLIDQGKVREKVLAFRKFLEKYA